MDIEAMPYINTGLKTQVISIFKKAGENEEQQAISNDTIKTPKIWRKKYNNIIINIIQGKELTHYELCHFSSMAKLAIVAKLAKLFVAENILIICVWDCANA